MTASTTHVPRPRGYPEQWVLLSRMAVATDVQGLGIGKRLTQFVCDFALRSYVVIGTRGVVVDAKPAATAFYRSFGFTAFEAFPTAAGTTRLMLPNENMKRFLEVNS